MILDMQELICKYWSISVDPEDMMKNGFASTQGGAEFFLSMRSECEFGIDIRKRGTYYDGELHSHKYCSTIESRFEKKYAVSNRLIFPLFSHLAREVMVRRLQELLKLLDLSREVDKLHTCTTKGCFCIGLSFKFVYDWWLKTIFEEYSKGRGMKEGKE